MDRAEDFGKKSQINVWRSLRGVILLVKVEKKDPAFQKMSALQEYQKSKCDKAFQEILDKHFDLVFGTAFRVVQDHQIAEDVAQATFLVLAKKAACISRPSKLGAWLHRTATHQALAARRKRMNDQTKINRYGETLSPEASSTSNSELQSKLDVELNKLPESDRSLLIQHYFNGLTFKEIGIELKQTEAACQRRAWRIVRRLQSAFGKKGVTVTTAALAAVLGTEFAIHFPAAIAERVTTKTLLAKGAVLQQGPLHAITGTFTNLMTKKIVISAAFLSGMGWFAGNQIAGALEQDATEVPDQRTKDRSTEVALTSRTKVQKSPMVSWDKVCEEIMQRIENDEISSRLEADDILSRIDAKEFLVALEYVESLDSGSPKLKRVVQRLLMGAWASKDPASALKHAENISDPDQSSAALHEVYRSWALVDPASAWASSRERGAPFQGTVVRHWIFAEPDSALEKIRSTLKYPKFLERVKSYSEFERGDVFGNIGPLRVRERLLDNEVASVIPMMISPLAFYATSITTAEIGSPVALNFDQRERFITSVVNQIGNDLDSQVSEMMKGFESMDRVEDRLIDKFITIPQDGGRSFPKEQESNWEDIALKRAAEQLLKPRLMFSIKSLDDILDSIHEISPARGERFKNQILDNFREYEKRLNNEVLPRFIPNWKATHRAESPIQERVGGFSNMLSLEKEE